MKKIISTFLFYFLLVAVYATPEKANWKRILFIGHNGSFCYYYQLERIQPGNYYNYIEKLSLIKQSLQTDSIIEAINLRETEFKVAPRDTSPYHRYLKVEKITDPVNTEKYLIAENVNYQFHSLEYSGNSIQGLILDEQGLSYQYNDKIALILNNKVLEKKIPGFQNMFRHESGKPRMIEYYKDKTYCFIIIEQGVDCYDTDMIQTLLIVKATEEEVIKTLIK